MLSKLLELTDEMTSPLFRIISGFDIDDPVRKKFDNNVCAFHIGNGYILTVAHNLTAKSVLPSMSEQIYQNELMPLLGPVQKNLVDRIYKLDNNIGKRFLDTTNERHLQKLIEIYNTINFDSRSLTQYQKNISQPYLVAQFRTKEFYNDSKYSKYFNASTTFYEDLMEVHTFLLPLELVNIFFKADIALYKIKDTDKEIISRLPKINVDFSLLTDDQVDCFCLQSAPSGEMGRMTNRVQLEGYIDHSGPYADNFGLHFNRQGLRYLIKGYFRFGSSGAPYVFLNEQTGEFTVNAIQSEASPIQLSINNDRNGNFQYVNAIASPLHIVKDELSAILGL